MSAVGDPYCPLITKFPTAQKTYYYKLKTLIYKCVAANCLNCLVKISPNDLTIEKYHAILNSTNKSISQFDGFPMKTTYLKNEVKSLLLTHIKDNHLQPGDKLPTQRELARRLQVSPKVAEIALKELEKDGLIVRRVGSGTFLARSHEIVSTVPNGGRNVFVLIPNLRNPQFTEFAAECETLLLQESCRMRLVTGKGFNSFRDLVNLMVEEGCGGIITMFIHPSLKEFAESRKVPVVQIHIRKPGPFYRPTTHDIVLDIGDQAKILAEHLLALGHRNFYLAGGQPEKNEAMCYRFKVMERILRKAGATIRIVSEKMADGTELRYDEIGKKLVSDILSLNAGPGVAVFYNTARALGAMKMFLHLGRKIPQDISIAAFDNIFAAKLVEPELTVTDARYIEAAKLAVELIASHECELKSITIPPVLCQGKSIAAINR